MADGNPAAMRIYQQMQAQQAAYQRQENAVQEYHYQMQVAMQQLAHAAKQTFTGTELEILAYSHKPRLVDFKPYSLGEFKEKNYDIKGQKGYWELPKRSPVESEDVLAKVRQAAGAVGIRKGAH